MDAGIVLIVAFVSVAVGYGAGLFLTRANDARKKREADEKSGETGPKYENTKLAVSLWSKTPDGPLHADLFGKTFTSAEQVSIAEKNRLARDIQMIESWFGIKEHHPTKEPNPAILPAAPQPEANASFTEAQPIADRAQVNSDELVVSKQNSKEDHNIPEILTEKTALEDSVNEISQIPDEQKPATAEISQPLPPEASPPVKSLTFTSASELDVPSKILEPTVPILKPPVIVIPDTREEPVKPVEARIDLIPKAKPAPVPKSIVQQIDEILQEHVANTPMAAVGVKLQETPQGVLVWIGKESFQGVDSVPDGDAKKLIKAAVKEWESRG
jgi:hypothetical protein